MKKRLTPKITPWGVKVGTKIEMEHTKSKTKAERIALDHLKEYGDDYYKELIKVEEKLARKYGRASKARPARV